MEMSLVLLPLPVQALPFLSLPIFLVDFCKNEMDTREGGCICMCATTDKCGQFSDAFVEMFSYRHKIFITWMLRLREGLTK